MGISRIDFKKFVLYTTLGSIPWTAAFVYAGYKLGENFVILVHYVDMLKIPIVIIIVALLAYYVYNKLKKSDK